MAPSARNFAPLFTAIALSAASNEGSAMGTSGPPAAQSRAPDARDGSVFPSPRDPEMAIREEYGASNENEYDRCVEAVHREARWASSGRTRACRAETPVGGALAP